MKKKKMQFFFWLENLVYICNLVPSITQESKKHNIWWFLISKIEISDYGWFQEKKMSVLCKETVKYFCDNF